MPYKPVDTAIKVILGPAIDDTDFKTREEALTYDQAGMEVTAIMELADGTVVDTAITPTTGDDHDWAHTNQGYYELEIPASAGDFNNDEEGVLTVAAFCTGVLPFRSVAYDIVPIKVYNSLVDGSDNLEVDTIQWLGTACTAPAVAGTPSVDVTKIENADPTDTINASCDSALSDYDAPTKTEMDSAFTEIKGATWASGTDTLEHIRNKQTDIEADTNELQGDWTNAGRLDTIIDSILTDTGTTLDGKVDSILTDTGTTLDGKVDSILTDTGTTLDGKIDTIDGIVDAILVDTGTTLPAAIPNAAAINAEVADVIKTDTKAEPAAPPAATSSIEDKINWIFTILRDKQTFNKDTGVHTLRNDADNGDIATRTITDDGTTLTKPEWS